MRKIFSGSAALDLLFAADPVREELKVGDSAPLFELKTHEGKTFDLAHQRGRWTILYFYPKADTPGCTKQACLYRDSIEKIRNLGVDVFGISADTVDAQALFREKFNLNYPLLADPQGKAIQAYGTKMPLGKMSRRSTFIIDPNLIIRSVEENVDPVKDAENVVRTIDSLQKKSANLSEKKASHKQSNSGAKKVRRSEPQSHEMTKKSSERDSQVMTDFEKTSSSEK